MRHSPHPYDRNNLIFWLRLCIEVYSFWSVWHALHVNAFLILNVLSVPSIYAPRYSLFSTLLMKSPHFDATFKGKSWLKIITVSCSHLWSNLLSLPSFPLVKAFVLPWLIFRTVVQYRPRNLNPLQPVIFLIGTPSLLHDQLLPVLFRCQEHWQTNKAPNYPSAARRKEKVVVI